MATEGHTQTEDDKSSDKNQQMEHKPEAGVSKLAEKFDSALSGFEDSREVSSACSEINATDWVPPQLLCCHLGQATTAYEQF